MRTRDWVVVCAAMGWAGACGGQVLDHGSADSTGAGSGGSNGKPSRGGSNITSPAGRGDPNTATGAAGTVTTGAAGTVTTGTAGTVTTGAAGTVTTGAAGTPPIGIGPIPFGAGGNVGTGGAPPTPPSGTTMPPPGVPSDAGAGVRVDYALGGVTHDGHVVAADWTGSVEEVVLLDPTTGLSTYQGFLGNLHWWSFQFIYDDRTRTAYAVGQDAAYRSYVYSFSLDTKTSEAVPLQEVDGGHADYFLGGVTATGSIVAAYWTGSAEAVVLIDPTTGGTSYAGTLDGLTTWQGQITYDDSTQTVYAIGDGASFDTDYVFSQKLGNDETKRVLLSSHDGGVIDYVIGGLSKNSQLITAYWDGARERIALLDPLTGSTQVVGSVGDLMTWQSQLVYARASGILIAYGWAPNGTAHLYAVPLGK